jgi:hypothetical protein
MLRDHFLFARPPLLAAMQGGEWPRLQFVHTFYDCAAQVKGKHGNKIEDTS